MKISVVTKDDQMGLAEACGIQIGDRIVEGRCICVGNFAAYAFKINF